MVKVNLLILASLCLVLLWSTNAVNGRYLPTRSNEDSLDKLRDLLRDILESDKPVPHPDARMASSMYDGHYAYGGPKYLRKREVNGWDFYDPSSSIQQPRH